MAGGTEIIWDTRGFSTLGGVILGVEVSTVHRSPRFAPSQPLTGRGVWSGPHP